MLMMTWWVIFILLVAFLVEFVVVASTSRILLAVMRLKAVLLGMTLESKGVVAVKDLTRCNQRKLRGD